MEFTPKELNTLCGAIASENDHTLEVLREFVEACQEKDIVSGGFLKATAELTDMANAEMDLLERLAKVCDDGEELIEGLRIIEKNRRFVKQIKEAIEEAYESPVETESVIVRFLGNEA